MVEQAEEAISSTVQVGGGVGAVCDSWRQWLLLVLVVCVSLRRWGNDLLCRLAVWGMFADTSAARTRTPCLSHLHTHTDTPTHPPPMCLPAVERQGDAGDGEREEVTGEERAGGRRETKRSKAPEEGAGLSRGIFGSRGHGHDLPCPA